MPRHRFLRNVVIVGTTIAVLPLTIVTLWASGWYSGLTRQELGSAGTAQGFVWRPDMNSRTVHVSSNPLGAHAVPFVLSPTARVVVGDKEGGFGDLREGMVVALTYQRHGDVLVAVCVESLRGMEHDAQAGRCAMASPPHPPAGVASLDVPPARGN